MRLVLIGTSVFHGLLRTVGFADYQITIPVNLGIFKTDIESCPGVSDQNEKPGKRRGGDLAREWLLSGRVTLPSLNFPGLNLGTPFKAPYALGLSAYPDGPFSALGPRSLLLPSVSSSSNSLSSFSSPFPYPLFFAPLFLSSFLSLLFNFSRRPL